MSTANQSTLASSRQHIPAIQLHTSPSDDFKVQDLPLPPGSLPLTSYHIELLVEGEHASTSRWASKVSGKSWAVPRTQEALDNTTCPHPTNARRSGLGPRPSSRKKTRENLPKQQRFLQAARPKVGPCLSLSGLLSLFRAWKRPQPQEGKIPLAAGTGSVCHSSSAGRLRFSFGLQHGSGPHTPPFLTTALFLASFLEAEVWWVTGRDSRPAAASHSSGQAHPTSPGTCEVGFLPQMQTPANTATMQASPGSAPNPQPESSPGHRVVITQENILEQHPLTTVTYLPRQGRSHLVSEATIPSSGRSVSRLAGRLRWVSPWLGLVRSASPRLPAPGQQPTNTPIPPSPWW